MTEKKKVVAIIGDIQAAGDDKLIGLLRRLQGAYEVWLLEVRAGWAAQEVLAWVHEHRVPYDVILIRDAEDKARFVDLKKRWADEYGLASDVVHLAFDRDGESEALWASRGVDCYRLPSRPARSKGG